MQGQKECRILISKNIKSNSQFEKSTELRIKNKKLQMNSKVSTMTQLNNKIKFMFSHKVYTAKMIEYI